MAVSKKTITIAHLKDNTTLISVINWYRSRCDNRKGAYVNGRRSLPQEPVAKLRELQQFIDEVIPRYIFHKSVELLSDHTTVSHELESDLLCIARDHPLRDHDSTCLICSREFEDGDDIRALPECMHEFHVDCIDGWLCSHSTCPICKANTPVEHTTLASIYFDSSSFVSEFS